MNSPIMTFPFSAFQLERGVAEHQGSLRSKGLEMPGKLAIELEKYDQACHYIKCVVAKEKPIFRPI